MPKTGLDVCEEIMEYMRARGKKIGEKLTHEQVDYYIEAAAGMSQVTKEKYRRVLCIHGFLKLENELPYFRIERFLRAEGAKAFEVGDNE